MSRGIREHTDFAFYLVGKEFGDLVGSGFESEFSHDESWRNLLEFLGSKKFSVESDESRCFLW